MGPPTERDPMLAHQIVLTWLPWRGGGRPMVGCNCVPDPFGPAPDALTAVHHYNKADNHVPPFREGDRIGIRGQGIRQGSTQEAIDELHRSGGRLQMAIPGTEQDGPGGGVLQDRTDTGRGDPPGGRGTRR